MNIAFVHFCFGSGGAERITINIAEYLSGFGNAYKTYLYANNIQSDRLTPQVREFLTVREISKYQVERSVQVDRLVDEDKIDILVLVSYKLPGIEDIVRRTGVKVIFANHGEPFWERYSIIHRRQRTPFRTFLWKTYRRKLYMLFDLARKKAVRRSYREYKRCDAYTVLCEAYRQQTAKKFKIPVETSHLVAIENPEEAVLNPTLEKENIILFCGRLENTSKRVDRLLHIWKEVQDQLPDWKLQLVGDGPEGEQIRQLAQDLELKNISFEGLQKDTAPYYRKASIVVLTSQTEGWPLCLSEAQAHGCIPVAFNCTAGVKAILEPDGECGFIVPPFNREKYAETLVKVARLPEPEKMKIRKAAIAKRLQYTPDIISEKWRLLFESLLQNR